MSKSSILDCISNGNWVSGQGFFRFFLILLISMFAGCGPFVDVVKVGEDTAIRLDAEVRVYEDSEIKPSQYKYLGTAKATSCKNLIWEPSPTKEDAVAQLKLKAKNMGGNGIVNIVCKESGTSFDRNCCSSVTCDAVAIKTEFR